MRLRLDMYLKLDIRMRSDMSMGLEMRLRLDIYLNVDIRLRSDMSLGWGWT